MIPSLLHIATLVLVHLRCLSTEQIVASDIEHHGHSWSADGWLFGRTSHSWSQGNPRHLHRSVCMINFTSFEYGCQPYIALTGVFILLSTTARSSNSYLGWDCGYSFTNNVMYGVLYALSPELFPTKDRGTGNSLVAAANRIFGVMVRV